MNLEHKFKNIVLIYFYKHEIGLNWGAETGILKRHFRARDHEIPKPLKLHRVPSANGFDREVRWLVSFLCELHVLSSSE